MTRSENSRECVLCRVKKDDESYDMYELQHDFMLCCHYPSENDGDYVKGLVCTECADEVMLWVRTNFPNAKIENYILKA